MGLNYTYQSGTGIDEYDLADLRMEVAAKACYNRKLAAHPQCADPDHPGCYRCDPDDPELEEAEEADDES